VPRAVQNRKLFEKTVGFVTRSLGSFARSTGGAVILDEGTDVRPNILTANEGKGPVDSKMTGEWMIVFELEYPESEIVNVRNVHPAIKAEETLVVDRPAGSRRSGKVPGGKWVRRKGSEDISVKLVKVHNNGGPENGSDESGGSE